MNMEMEDYYCGSNPRSSWSRIVPVIDAEAQVANWQPVGWKNPIDTFCEDLSILKMAEFI